MAQMLQVEKNEKSGKARKRKTVNREKKKRMKILDAG